MERRRRGRTVQPNQQRTNLNIRISIDGGAFYSNINCTPAGQGLVIIKWHSASISSFQYTENRCQPIPLPWEHGGAILFPRRRHYLNEDTTTAIIFINLIFNLVTYSYMCYFKYVYQFIFSDKYRLYTGILYVYMYRWKFMSDRC